MKIECLGNIVIVDTKPKPYWYKRNAYYVGNKKVKAKKIRKFKTVKLKEPYLSGNIRLIVDEHLTLGGVYQDNNGLKYICDIRLSIKETLQSQLRVVNTNLGKTFSCPKQLVCIMQTFPEKARGEQDKQ